MRIYSHQIGMIAVGLLILGYLAYVLVIGVTIR